MKVVFKNTPAKTTISQLNGGTVFQMILNGTLYMRTSRGYVSLSDGTCYEDSNWLTREVIIMKGAFLAEGYE